MNRMNGTLALVILLVSCGGANEPLPVVPQPPVAVKWTITPATVSLSSKGETRNLIVEANGEWTVVSNQSWLTVSPSRGSNGQTSVKITATGNPGEQPRDALLTFSSGDNRTTYTVKQEGPSSLTTFPKGTRWYGGRSLMPTG